MSDLSNTVGAPSEAPRPTRRVHMVTYGCQMNVFDTRRILQVLRGEGFEETPDAAMADLILLNTCSVRAGAEQKVVGTLTRLWPLKQANPHLVMGVCGCVGQQHGRELLQKVRFLDLVFGTDNIADLPALLRDVGRGERVAHTERLPRDAYEFVDVDPSMETGPAAYLTVMKGCDKVCAYCIVPRVRGREVSKPVDKVLAEVRALVDAGVREVTLLGQNVNSYGKDLPGRPDFTDLLEQVDAVPGLARLRFVTSHPEDADERMLTAFGRLTRLAEYLHLPVQSGSDRILAAMRRGYTSSEYLRKLAVARAACPDLAVSTDIIVGFPGETEQDFQETLRVVETARYEMMFSFKYSPRPGTTAARLADDVPEAEKARRLKVVQDLQDRITAERMARYLGREEEVLVEGPSSRSDARRLEVMGRTRTNWVVNVPVETAPGPRAGDVVRVRIDEVLPHCFRGALVRGPLGS